jgi:hypothetical protein
MLAIAATLLAGCRTVKCPQFSGLMPVEVVDTMLMPEWHIHNESLDGWYCIVFSADTILRPGIELVPQYKNTSWK